MSAAGPAGDAGGSAGGSSPVEAVIFDWGGTLTPWHTIDHLAQWEAFAAGSGAPQEARPGLATRLLEAEAHLWARARGEGHRSGALPEVLAAVGLDPVSPRVAAGLAAYREFWVPHTITHPQVRPLFEGLRSRGLRIGVLSNTLWSREYHRGVFERDGVLGFIDGDVYSSEIAHTKPHPQIFAEAARRVGVPAARCVYVGDRAFEDIHGGHEAGMRAILVPHSDIPLDQLVEIDAVPDAVAHELIDILSILDTWASRR
ncbi:HAD family hydrolase [Piscicoccus intestinalis]|uniref:HAD family hydrolase n=1 Tax=Piscicoccus intestinalis TaxID=746033 RepID=UPI000837C896|nr:HAD family hydrolase [Piscicoccus intestinalis]